MGIRIGTSFSPRRCARFGISVQSTFTGVLEAGFALVRVSAYWDEIRKDGYAQLDWLIETAGAAGRPVVVTVGMKGIQWPEFYLPPEVHPDPARNGRIGREPGFANEVVGFVREVVARYREQSAIVAWQVENEPFNRSGPRSWWIDEALVRGEMEAVRALDARPIVLNAFSHFDRSADSGSRPRRGLAGLGRLVPEKAILNLLGPSDVLGLDVYTAIGERRAAPDWADSARRWLRAARHRGNEAWIIEAQAEPWEPSRDTWANPRSFAPADMGAVFDPLVRVGYSTLLLWGCEYWFWRAGEGDRRWLDAAGKVLRGT
jgi:hypothetical protein